MSVRSYRKFSNQKAIGLEITDASDTQFLPMRKWKMPQSILDLSQRNFGGNEKIKRRWRDNALNGHDAKFKLKKFNKSPIVNP